MPSPPSCVASTSASTHASPSPIPRSPRSPTGVPADEVLAAATARAEAIRLAKRITILDTELNDNHTRTAELLEASPAAALLDEKGIGPVIAAVVYTAWSHLGRVRSEAA